MKLFVILFVLAVACVVSAINSMSINPGLSVMLMMAAFAALGLSFLSLWLHRLETR